MDPRCEEVMHQIWNSRRSRDFDKLSALKGLDDVFQEYRIGDINKEIKRIGDLLKEDEILDSSEESIKTNRALEGQSNNLLQMEEVIWRQRSRALWLKHGDKNAKFFHGKAEQRRKTNNIQKLKDENGHWWRVVQGKLKSEHISGAKKSSIIKRLKKLYSR